MVRLVARIGILGGTFDPPHIGHLILAEYSLEALNLDKVLLVPVGSHPFKRDDTRLPVENRVAMLRLAIEDNPHLELSLIDVNREGPHFSADMVKLLHQQHPYAQLHFLLGSDNLRELPTWTRPEDIYAVARIAVMKRSDEIVDPTIHDDNLAGLSEKVDIIPAPLSGVWISSSEITERLKEGKSVRYLIPDVVLDYIREHGLYAS